MVAGMKSTVVAAIMTAVSVVFLLHFCSSYRDAEPNGLKSRENLLQDMRLLLDQKKSPEWKDEAWLPPAHRALAAQTHCTEAVAAVSSILRRMPVPLLRLLHCRQVINKYKRELSIAESKADKCERQVCGHALSIDGVTTMAVPCRPLAAIQG